jgi:hypothetical protein
MKGTQRNIALQRAMRVKEKHASFHDRVVLPPTATLTDSRLDSKDMTGVSTLRACGKREHLQERLSL